MNGCFNILLSIKRYYILASKCTLLFSAQNYQLVDEISRSVRVQLSMQLIRHFLDTTCSGDCMLLMPPQKRISQNYLPSTGNLETNQSQKLPFLLPVIFSQFAHQWTRWNLQFPFQMIAYNFYDCDFFMCSSLSARWRKASGLRVK